MNAILHVLENLTRGTVTLRFPERPPAPTGYRGLVEMDPALCQGCGMCAFACTSRSITFRPSPTAYDWAYEPGQCTFCGRCVDACASHALSMQSHRPPVYTRSGALRRAHTLPRKPPPGAKPPAPAAAPGGAR